MTTPVRPACETMKNNLFPPKHSSLDGLMLIVAVLTAWLLMGGTAWATTPARPPGMVDLEALRAEANVATDLATSIFNNLFGPIFASPFTSVSGATTLFGVIFLAFNVVVFSAGVVWATYGVVAGVVQSAHEGVVLGKRMSAIWMPVRMVTGIGSLVPAFGGFSLSQVVMIAAAGWGITFGNYAYLKALAAANQFTPLVNMQIKGVGDQNQTAIDLAYAIFKQELCVRDELTHQASYNSMGIPVPVNEIIQTQPSKLHEAASGSAKYVGAAYGSTLDRGKCGVVGIRYVGDSVRSSTSFFGFRNANVDYNAISSGVYDRYAGAYARFSADIIASAREYVNGVHTSGNTTTMAEWPVPVGRIEQITSEFLSSVGRANAGADNGTALKSAALDNMKQFGFLGAGAFYSTFAELNSSIAQATQAVNFIIVAPSGTSQNAAENSSPDRTRFQNAFDNQMTTKLSAAPQLSATPGGSCANGNGYLSGIIGAFTGGCSFGQTVVDMLLRGATAGSSSGGTNSFRMIDPIIAAKNLGDYFMVGGQTLLGVMSVAKDFIPESESAKPASKASSVWQNIKKMNPISYLAQKIGGAIVSILPIIAGLMIGLGALLSIYIPMVPFINWVSAIVQYVSTVVEALAAAPLWSFTHLQPDGEGMGSRTERGYIYLLLMLFSPILMIIGFFAACGLVVLTGSAVLWLFMPAMANVQGNSITGIFSVIGFVFIFFLLMNILIQGLFNLTMDLKDDVIGWIGNVGRSQIGRDTENKASNLFVMGGRIASGHAQMTMANGIKPKSDPPGPASRKTPTK